MRSKPHFQSSVRMTERQEKFGVLHDKISRRWPNGANIKTHTPLTTIEYPTAHPTFLIELPSTGRSTQLPPASSNANQSKKKVSSISSLYAHSNLSGDLHSPGGVEQATPALLPLQLLPWPLPTQRFPTPRNPSSSSRSPALSLLRSRRKLWKKDCLDITSLSSIPEREEGVQSDGRLATQCEKLRFVEELHPPTSVPTEVEDVFFSGFHRFAQTPSLPYPMSGAPIFSSKVSCPPFGFDEETDSSSSDDELDAYEFDLSSCRSTPLDGLDSPTPPVEPGFFGAPTVKRSTVSAHGVRKADCRLNEL